MPLRQRTAELLSEKKTERIFVSLVLAAIFDGDDDDRHLFDGPKSKHWSDFLLSKMKMKPKVSMSLSSPIFSATTTSRQLIVISVAGNDIVSII